MMSEDEKFQALKSRLPAIWSALPSDPRFEHTAGVLDDETESGSHGVQPPPLDRRLPVE
jgi:hypothetical protein